MADVEVDRDGQVLVVRLNRPEHKNAVGGSMLRLLLEAFRAASDDDDIRAVVTVGEGGTFCVGADVKALSEATTSTGEGRPNRGGDDNGLPPLSPQSAWVEPLGTPGRWVKEMLALDKPTIAAVNGAAAGGGLCIAALHDFRVADPSAKFVAGFTAIGLTTEMGLVHSLPRLVGIQAARRMLLRNETVRGDEGHRIGLVDQLADGDVLESALRFANDIAKLPPLGVRITKQLLRTAQTASFDDTLAAEFRAQQMLFASADHQEAIAAFRERRPGSFSGR